MGEEIKWVGARPRREFLAGNHNLAFIFDYYGFFLVG
jgi:hypothetical protein